MILRLMLTSKIFSYCREILKTRDLSMLSVLREVIVKVCSLENSDKVYKLVFILSYKMLNDLFKCRASLLACLKRFLPMSTTIEFVKRSYLRIKT